MTERPIPGRPGDPADGDAEGIILFDPTPPPPLPVPVEEEASWGRTALLLLLGITVIGAGGYQLYSSRTPPASPLLEPVESVALEPEVPAGGGALIAMGENTLLGPAGSSMQIAVRAVGPGGMVFADSTVHFSVTEGGGELESETARTDGDGVARTLVRLPTRSGRVVVLAELAGSELSTEIPVLSRAGTAAQILSTAGDDQQGDVGELLPQRLTVAVTDASGNPVPGIDVIFTVEQGEGQVGPSRARTDTLGVASVLWRLGPVPGTQQVSATVRDLEGSAAFAATAFARPVVLGGRVLPAEIGAVTVEPRDYVVGGTHVCRLEGGVARCRGANDRGQRAATPPSGLAALATGMAHVCGLNETGEAFCWGSNEGGQLGDGSRADRQSPVPVRTDLRFSMLAAGSAHTCGLAGGGVPICWGQNLSGQLGDGSRADARFPTAVGGGLNFSILVAGWSHTCGLTFNGNAWCWGLNSDGQLGDGSRLDQLVPTLVRGSIVSLAAGSAHTCGISDTEVLCWGANRFGQLGDGTGEDRVLPVAVQGLPDLPRDLASGAVHTCALLADGTVYCWGQNLFGQLGDGSTENRNRASPVAGGMAFRSIEAGGALTCGLTTDGTEYCWGFNQNGQLGDGTRENRALPTPVLP